VDVPEGVDPEEVANPAVGEAAIEAAERAEHPQQYVFTVTDGGFAKKTVVEQYRLQGRGGIGIKVMRADDERGSLVGATVVAEGDEVLAIRSSGQVTRSQVSDVSSTGRDTMGVKFVDVRAGDEVVAIARNADADVEELQEATVHDTGVMPQPLVDEQEPG